MAMKTFTLNILTLLLSLVIVGTSFAQQGYSKVYEKQWEALQSSSIINTFDDNLMIGGSYEGENLILKINPEGDIIWNKTFGSSNTYEPSLRIKKLLDSTYLSASTSYMSENQEYGISFVKMSENGDTIWTSLLTLTNYLSHFSIEQVYDSGYLISSGIYINESPPYSEMLIIKLDKFAQYEWAKSIDILNNTNAACSVVQTPDSNFIVSGYAYNSNEYLTELILLKISIEGDFIWSKTYSYPNTNWDRTKVVVLDNSLLLLGGTNNHIFILKTTNDGEIIWSKKLNVYSENFFNYVNINAYTLTDSELAILSPDNLIKIDSDGEIIWSTSFWMYTSDFTVLNNEFYVSGNGPLLGVKKVNIESPPQIGLCKLDSNGINNTDCIMGGDLNYELAEFDTDTLIINATDIVFSNSMFPMEVSSKSFSVSDKCVDFIGGLSRLDDSKITIYPNPNYGNFEIATSQGMGILKIQIFNTSGQLVYDQTNNGESNMQIKITENLHGIFLLKVFSENSTLCKKLIIN